MEKSFEPITEQDLKELVKLTLIEHETFFKRKPEYESFYKNTLLAIVLGQGASSHYRDGKYGIKDFDIYIFYKEHPEKRMWIRRVKKIKSNLEKFGNPNVDFMRKAIKTKYIDGNEDNIEKIILRFLSESKTQTAKFLTIWVKKEKNRTRNIIVGLYPESIFKKILWEGEIQVFK